MAKLKKLGLWFALLTKRLYRKPAFVVILLLIPAMLVSYRATVRTDSGVLTLAMAVEDPGDPYARESIQALSKSGQLIRFISCDTAEEAEKLVRTGKADGAWIFPEQMEARVRQFVETRAESDAIVQILQREDTVALRLAREKLSGILFRCCARQLYLDELRQNAPDLAALSDETLMRYFDEVSIDGTLFRFTNMDGSESVGQVHYLLSPVRGLLAVVIALCALAAAMYYIQDEKTGIFAWLPQRRQPMAELGCQLVCLANLTAVVLISLAISGLGGSPAREVAISALYCLCCAAFSMLLRRLCGSLRLMGALLPLLAVTMTAVCPVFFDFSILRQVQLLFPPTYYIRAINQTGYLLYMPCYAVVCLSACFLTDSLRRS